VEAGPGGGDVHLVVACCLVGGDDDGVSLARVHEDARGCDGRDLDAVDLDDLDRVVVD